MDGTKKQFLHLRCPESTLLIIHDLAIKIVFLP